MFIKNENDFVKEKINIFKFRRTHRWSFPKKKKRKKGELMYGLLTMLIKKENTFVMDKNSCFDIYSHH